MTKIIRLTESDLMRIVKRVINEQQGTVYKLRQLERDGYQLLPGTIPPEGKLIDSGIESLGTTKSAVKNDLLIKLSKMGIMMNDTKKGYPLFKEEPDKKVRFKWFMTENSAVKKPTENSSIKKPIDITSKVSPLNKDVSYKPGYGKPNTGVPVFNFGGQSDVTSSDFYSSILGYIDMNWESLINVGNRDTFDMRQARKEVMIYCEDMRDYQKANPLTSNLSKSMFKTISKLVKESPNVQELIKRGKNIKINRFA